MWRLLVYVSGMVGGGWGLREEGGGRSEAEPGGIGIFNSAVLYNTILNLLNKILLGYRLYVTNTRPVAEHGYLANLVVDALPSLSSNWLISSSTNRKSVVKWENVSVRIF